MILFSGTETETKAFMAICVETLKRFVDFTVVHNGEMLQNFKNYFVPLCHSCWLVLFYI